MTREPWRQHLQVYVALRRAIGFSMRREARCLEDFVEHLERHGHNAPVAQVAVEWASASTESQHARRLSIVRAFLTMVRAAEPAVDVPDIGLVRTSRRPTPRILEPHEIVSLMRVPTRSVQKYTLRTRPETSGAHEAVQGGPGHARQLGDGGLRDAQLEEAPDLVLLAVEP